MLGISYTLSGNSASVTFGTTNNVPQISTLTGKRYSSVDVVSWYTNPAEANIFIDADGVIQTYSLSGEFSPQSSNIASINTFITSMNAMLSGAQIDHVVTFTSGSGDVPSSLNLTVAVTSFEYEWTNDSMTSITWTIELTVAVAP